MSIQSFKVDIPQATLDDLRERLARTRWPDQVEGAGWDYGTNLKYLKGLADYWHHQYDWRKQEAALNQFHHFKVEIDDMGVHFVHERGKGPNPLPLLLFHGWPDSFYRYYKLIPMLTDPARFGAEQAESFDIIVPSLPGFGFSDRPTVGGYRTADANALWTKLMSEVLGYRRYGAAGGDTGSPIAQLLALSQPKAVVGIHLTDIGWHNNNPTYPDLSEAEQQYLAAGQGWFFQEGAYTMIQATKPQTLAYGLNDSPVGLAAWIVEKFRAWSDCNGEVERSYTKDELLTNIMIYWATETINSSMRTYYEEYHHPSLSAGQRIDVPVGMALFPKDPPQGPLLPRTLAERSLRIEHWTEMPRGGHFAALEEPALLAEDMRAFFRPLR